MFKERFMNDFNYQDNGFSSGEYHYSYTPKKPKKKKKIDSSRLM